MDTSAGRDGRFNLGYNMSLLGGDTSPDMYGGGRSSSASLGGMGGGLTGTCGPAGGGPPRGLKRTSSDVCFLDGGVSGRGGGGLDCGADLMDDGGYSPAPQKSGPPPNGKKTKGRVKIKMEYIDNKLRRYTTFSKRKTGIMKKAYELSTLTGTQVMLLVASETGHVYTFATRKLQPMITSEAGKALIQTCLNSPDPCPSSGGGSGGGGGSDQRMSATGFEETELSYNIGDDEQKAESDDAMPSPRSVDDGDMSGGESSGGESPRALSPEPKPKFTLPDMIRAGIKNVLQKGGGGTSLTPASAPEAHQQTSTSTSSPLTSSASLISTSYPGVMYQTAQGLVYATPSPSLPNGVILSLPPGIQLQPHNEANGSSASSSSSSAQAAAAAVLRQPQFIRIPFPMALSDPQVSVPSQSRNIMSEAADLSKGRK